MNIEQHELNFPCEYPIKIIGFSNELFKKNVLNIVYQHFKCKVSDDLISYKTSRNKRYLSITVRFMAESRSQVDDIYQDLKSCEEVVQLI